MNNHHLIRENLLLEEFERLCSSRSIKKQAGLFQDLSMDSVAEWMEEYFHRHVKDASEVPGGYYTTIIHLLSASILFSVSPFWSMMYSILNHYGFNISDMAIRVANALEPELKNGKPISIAEIKSRAPGILSRFLNSSTSNQETNDTNEVLEAHAFYLFPGTDKNNTFNETAFEFLIKEAHAVIEKQQLQEIKLNKFKHNKNLIVAFKQIDQIHKMAIGQPYENTIAGKIFGDIFAKHGKKGIFSVAVALVVWLIVNTLKGFGLLAVSEGFKSILGLKPKSEVVWKKDPDYQEKIQKAKEKSDLEKEISSSSKPSSKPPMTDKARQSSDKIWVFPLIGDGSIEDTLTLWSFEFYPAIKQYPNINNVIRESKDFKNLVESLKSKSQYISSKYIALPPELNLTDRKSAVNVFILDVLRKLNDTKI